MCHGRLKSFALGLEGFCSGMHAGSHEHVIDPSCEILIHASVCSIWTTCHILKMHGQIICGAQIIMPAQEPHLGMLEEG